MRTLPMMLAVAAMGFGHARADDEAAGTITSDQSTIEILGSNGEREIRTPEGFIRVEPGQAPEEGTGSFSIVQASEFGEEADADPSPAPPPPPAVRELRPGPATASWRHVAVERSGIADTAAPQPGPDPCQEQRARYARRLLRSAGVDVDDPVALMQGLAGPGAYGSDILTSGYLFTGLDPIRPLAWDMELRSIARDLATCEQRASPPAG